MNLVEKATLVAIMAHDAIGQKRKFTDQPYWQHSCAVADRISLHSDDEALIAAGWLHDVVEDTHLDIWHIRSHFGNEVAQYVSDVTKQKPYGEHGDLNTLSEINRLMTVCSKSKLLKLCDIRCNIEDMSPECGIGFITEWLTKKFAMVLAIKQTSPEHVELCDEIITFARTTVRVNFPMACVTRMFGNGVNMLGKAMELKQKEEDADVDAAFNV